MFRPNNLFAPRRLINGDSNKVIAVRPSYLRIEFAHLNISCARTRAVSQCRILCTVVLLIVIMSPLPPMAMDQAAS